ncbi:DUF2785 domain-containing protein [Bacillus sp. B-TM1]
MICIGISDKYLLYKIHSSDEDAVFTRAFTTLLIALIIDADTNHNFCNCVCEMYSFLMR